MSTVGHLRVGVLIVVALFAVSIVLAFTGRLTLRDLYINVRLLLGAQVAVTGAIEVVEPCATNLESVLGQLLVCALFWGVTRQPIRGDGNGAHIPIPRELAEMTKEYPFIVAYHRNDTWWHEAPLPRRLHRCSAQTTAVQHDLVVERCACGAIRLDRHVWMDRNSRRRLQ